MALSEDDAVVFFAFQAPDSLPAGYEGLIAHTAGIGAKINCRQRLYWANNSPLGPTSHCQSAGPDESVMQLRTGPIVVCEALAMTVAHKDPKRAVKGLEGLESLRANLLSDKGAA